MDLQSRIDHARHPCGHTFRIYSEPTVPAPNLERPRVDPPSIQEVRVTMTQVGCDHQWAYEESWVKAFHPDGYTINAVYSRAGWLITGGPHNLLSYGVPDADALERFPAVLASVVEHARHLDRRTVRLSLQPIRWP